MEGTAVTCFDVVFVTIGTGMGTGRVGGVVSMVCSFVVRV
jgi:hypothetical protein